MSVQAEVPNTLNFFELISGERVSLKELAFLRCHRSRSWGRYENAHREDVGSIGVAGYLLFFRR